MKKIPPILTPIAVLMISTIVATATGVVGSSSYRSHTKETETTTTTTSESQSQQRSSSTTNSELIVNETSDSQQLVPETLDQNQKTTESSSPAPAVASSDSQGNTDDVTQDSQIKDNQTNNQGATDDTAAIN